MKEKKVSGSERKPSGRIFYVAAVALLSVFLVTGCSRERMETKREIDRIYKAAEKTAEDRETEGQELSEKFWRFHSVQADGITVTSRLPFEIEDILCISEGEEEWSVDRKSSGTQTYGLVSDVYEVTEESPDGYYATVMHVSAEFADQYEEPLYILSRNIETGKVKVQKYISSQEELDALPDDESRRDYKIYSNGTYGMSAGYQYAVAEKIGDEGEESR